MHFAEANEPRPYAAASPVCVLLSGGMDSAVCLHWAIETFGLGRVFAFAVNYGQQHRRELVSARQIAEEAGVELVLRTIAIPWQSSPLAWQCLDADTPVPGRNLILATLAAAEVTGRGGGTIVMGGNADTALRSVGCLPTFVLTMSAMLTASFDRPVTLRAPFLTYRKAELVLEAMRLGALDAVMTSWSCDRPRSALVRGPAPCGACPACAARAAAFEELDLLDAWGVA